jgi:hypothetical protein
MRSVKAEASAFVLVGHIIRDIVGCCAVAVACHYDFECASGTDCKEIRDVASRWLVVDDVKFSVRV